MAALLYAAKAADCPYEIVLVAANDPDAPGLTLAAAEGIATFGQSHKGMKRAAFDAIIDAQLRDAGAHYVALAGYMRLLSPSTSIPACCPNIRGWTRTSARSTQATAMLAVRCIS